MSFKSCINAHAMKGFLTEAQARDLLNEYEKLYRRYEGTMGDAAAAHTAAEHFVNIQQAIIMKKMENDRAHVVAIAKVKQDLKQRI